MLGLPSTTEVGRRLPKEAFYRNLKLDARTRDEFVHLIESTTIANSIKPTTTNLGDGGRVHEIMVLDIRLRGDAQPTRAIEAIASAKEVLEAEIAKLDAACRKARQINRKNELFAQLKAKQRELSELMRSRSPSPYVHKKDRPFAH